MILLTMIFNAVLSLLAIIGIYIISFLVVTVLITIIFGLFLKTKWRLEGLTMDEKIKKQKDFLENEPMTFISSIICIIPTFYIVMEIKQYLP